MSPDLIMHHGTIVTMDKNDRICEAIAVKEGEITAVGSNEEILAQKSRKTRFIDLEGKTLLPGFIDAHQHMFIFGFNLLYVDCRLPSIEAVVAAVKEKAEESGPDDWIIGWGYDEDMFKEKRKLHKSDFEGIEQPVFITRYCAHAASVNERALNMANITRHTAIQNGIIEKDEQGEPTGVLVEQAKSLVEKVMPDYTKEQMKEAIKLANNYYIKDGLTSVHEAGMGFFTDTFKEYEVLQEVNKEGNLDVRMYLMVLGDFFDEFMQDKEVSSRKDAKLRIGSMKLFGDGTLSGKTAAVSQDFKGSPGERGMLILTDEELEQRVTAAHKTGHQVAIHAIGDRTINQVLDVYEKVQTAYPKNHLRHRIEHSTITDERILMRMKKLGVIPVPQPALVYFSGDVYQKNLHEPAVHHVFANKDFIDYDLKPAGSSDCPIIPASPLLGIAVAMDRTTVSGHTFIPDQRVTLQEALRMYTIYAAHAAFEEDIKGSLEAGKVADMVVLPPGFMEFSSDEIKNTEVEVTIIGGEIVYQKTVDTNKPASYIGDTGN